MKLTASRRVTLISAIALLLLVVVYTQFRLSHHAAMPLPAAASEPVRPQVSVLTLTPGRYQASVTAYGSAESRYSLELTSQVAGRVLRLSPEFVTGRQVAAGTLLAQIDDTDYRSAVSSAQSTLEAARLALLEEERAAEQARQEWQASAMGGEPDSALVLHEPQLRAARASLEQAQTALAAARNDLANTQIRAPFAAVISSRAIAPGSYLQTGSSVAKLDDSEQLEISLPLAAKDWLQLPADISHASDTEREVELLQVETGQHWRGQLNRSEMHMDTETRQRAAIVTVDQPLQQNPPLLPGTFVEASLRGRFVDNLWQLPASALSQRGEIWIVDATDTLRKFATTSLFSAGGYIYVPVPNGLADAPQRVVVHPLSSYLPGLRVEVVDTAATVAAATTLLAKPDAVPSQGAAHE